MAVKIVPISEVRQNFKRILSLLESTGDPYFITQYSRPKAVLVRYEDYNNLVEQAEQSAAIERREGVSGGEASLEWDKDHGCGCCPTHPGRANSARRPGCLSPYKRGPGIQRTGLLS